MRLLLATVALLVLGVLVFDSTTVFAVTRTWDDGDPNNSFWDSNANWSDDTEPGPPDEAVVGGNPEVNTFEIIDELDNSGTIDITTGTLQPNSATTNNGTINVGDGSAILSQFNPGNSSTISGSGEIVLSNSDNIASSRASVTGGSNSGVPVTNGANHTIRGEGTIQLHWINDGIVRAEETTGDSSATLFMDNMSFVNNGELRTSAGATISMNNVAYSQGVAGQLIADTDGMFFSGVNTVLSGGSLETVGGGAFNQANVNSAITLSGITLNAPYNAIMTAGSGDVVGTSSGITNNSVITIDGQGSGTAELRFSSPGTLGGSGEVVLGGLTSRSLVTSFGQITQDANHTIRGAGTFNGTGFTNNGTILAQVLTESVLSQNSIMTNNGLMRADAGATILFQSSNSITTQGPLGVIEAADGGTIELRTTSISGGSLTTSGSGVINVVAQDPVLSDLTITTGSDITIPAGLRMNLAGSGITNNGTITLNSNSVNLVSTLEYDSTLTLDGTGEIVVNTVGSQIARIRSGLVGSVLTQAAGHTIRGDGWLIGDVVNNGTIAGDSPAEPIEIFSRLSGTGSLENVVINGSFSVDFGIHSPGASTTIADIDGSYSIQGLGRVILEIGGLTPGTEHDQLDGTNDSNSAISLGGTLDVLALNTGGYTPTAGDRFTIIESANPISGTFNIVNFPDVLGGRAVTWDPVDYSDPNKVVLEIATVDFFDADFDEDGDVDGDDLNNWQTGYGMGGASHMDGDANGDGRVDSADFMIWQRQVGLGVSPLVAAVSAVPEPNTGVLLCLGCLFWGRRRR